MVYSEVISNNLHKLLIKKQKYTKRDVDKLIKQGYNTREALFITKCTAIYYDAEMSNTLCLPVNKYILLYITALK